MGRIITPTAFMERRQRQAADTPYREPHRWTPQEMLALGQVGAEVASTVGTGIARGMHDAPVEPGAEPVVSPRQQAAQAMGAPPEARHIRPQFVDYPDDTGPIVPLPGAQPTQFDFDPGQAQAIQPQSGPPAEGWQMQDDAAQLSSNLFDRMRQPRGAEARFVAAAMQRAGMQRAGGPVEMQDPAAPPEPQAAPMQRERVSLSPQTMRTLAQPSASAAPQGLRHAAGPVSMSSLRQMAVEAARTGRREDAASMLETFRRHKDRLDVFPEQPSDWLTGAHKVRAERELIGILKEQRGEKADRDRGPLYDLQVQNLERELEAGVPESKAGKIAGQAERETARGREAAEQEAARTTQMQAKADFARDMAQAGFDRAKAQAMMAVLDTQNEPEKFKREMQNLRERTDLNDAQKDRIRIIIAKNLDERSVKAKEIMADKWQPANVSIASQSEYRQQDALVKRMHDAETAATSAEQALAQGDADLVKYAEENLNWKSVGNAQLDLQAAKKKLQASVASNRTTAKQAAAALKKLGAAVTPLRPDTAEP